jgi:hypothetical protein
MNELAYTHPFTNVYSLLLFHPPSSADKHHGAWPASGALHKYPSPKRSTGATSGDNAAKGDDGVIQEGDES